ncbi:hypothetical protein [Sediminivirga luteola]|uniref:hypothetical protein n=1 Tax=Sediminivirga luteola TaxID=1774748 RepID=UPI00166D8DF9|nr:hypothetical protein [Sediminivirga luteola]
MTLISGEITELRKVSVDARELAKEANATRDRQLEALTEEHIVTWKHEWEKRGSFHVEQTGRHDALNVRAIVFVDGECQVSERERVRPGDYIRFEFPEANLKEEAADRARLRDSAPDRYGIEAPYAPELFETSFEVHWRSAAGVQHSYGPVETTESY